MGTNTNRDYAFIGELAALVGGDESMPMYMCPDDGLLVLSPDVHDTWHAVGSGLKVPCRCQDQDSAAPGTYWFCPQHQRASYQGDVLRDGGILTNRRDLR